MKNQFLGSEWPSNFDNIDVGFDLLDTDTLRVISRVDDPAFTNKLKDEPLLAEAAAFAYDHIYQEELPPPTTIDQHESPPMNSDSNFGISAGLENTSSPTVNGANVTSSTTGPDEHGQTASPTSGDLLTVTNEQLTASLSQPPPPPPPLPPGSSVGTTNTKTPSPSASNSSTASTISLNPSAAAISASYRQQGGVLGALPSGAGLRLAPGGVYATASGLANGLSGQIIYGGKSST